MTFSLFCLGYFSVPGVIIMTSKKFNLITAALLAAAYVPLDMGLPACADETVVTTTTVQTEPFTAVSTVPSVVALNTHTGAKYPSSLRMVVGQKLVVKGNNAIDLLTMRYHQVGFNHCPSGKDVLTEVSEKGYKDTFVASRAGET